jgi:N-acetylglutamate synthase-like GNAT family acetyltransferase
MSSAPFDLYAIDTAHPLYAQVYQLREIVLRQPLGLSLKNEVLDGDKADTIVVAADDQTVVGCVMMKVADEHTIKLRQMAVAPDRQQQGIGRMLIAAAERIAWERGFETISLHARCSAADFYTKLGYEETGPVFEEVTIPHILMQKHK